MSKQQLIDENSILYANNVNKFMASFAPLSPDEAMEEIKVIWQTKGFIHPLELTAEIYKRQILEKDINLKVKKQELIDNIIKTSMAKDSLTGFDAKTLTPLLTGLAHLYGQTTGEPVAIIEGDFSNMGGTNEKYKQEMKGTRAFDGFEECDLAARITANIAYNSLENLIAGENQLSSSKKHLHAVRSGGDEVRLIVTGVAVNKVDAFVSSEVTSAIENFTAQANLQDHPHLKDPKNPYKQGFGLAFAVDDLSNPKLNPLNIIESLDKRIKLAKLDVGYKRKGKLAPEIEKAVSLEMKSQGYSDEDVKKANKCLKLEALKFSARCQQLKQGVSALDFIYKARDDKEGKTEFGRLANIAVKTEKSLFQGLKAARDYFEDPHTTKEKQLLGYLNSIGVAKNDNDIVVLQKTLSLTKDIDPPTGLSTGKNLIKDTEVFISDTNALNRKMFLNGGRVVEAKPKAFHIELGNLAGLNEISHQHADVILKDFARNIKESLQQNDLEEYNFALYHEGGGKVKMLLPPFAKHTDDKGNTSYQRINEERIARLSETLGKNWQQELNKQTIVDYFKSKGLPVDDDKGNPLKLGNGEPIYSSLGNKRIGDIPNPKRVWDKGVSVTVVRADLETNVAADIQLKKLSSNAEAQITKNRESMRKVYEQQKTNDNIKGAVLCKAIVKER